MSAAPATHIHGLRGEQIVGASAKDAARLLAACLSDHLKQRLAMVRNAHLALSGGSSATLLGAALAEAAALSASDWSRIHVWMVDERCVANDDPRLNFNLVRSALLANVPLPPDHLHPMPVLDVINGAYHYEIELRAALAERRDLAERRLDAVVLGMGADGHTASLFPGSPALAEQDRIIVLNDGDRVTSPRPRMTMTYPLLNRAHLIALLVTGESKKAALERAAAAPSDIAGCPVVGVVPDIGSRLLWFLDREAAAQGPTASGS